eukprot:scaffold181259_cov20-Tisochrysis_lutea.AAC.1
MTRNIVEDKGSDRSGIGKKKLHGVEYRVCPLRGSGHRFGGPQETTQHRPPETVGREGEAADGPQEVYRCSMEVLVQPGQPNFGVLPRHSAQTSGLLVEPVAVYQGSLRALNEVKRNRRGFGAYNYLASCIELPREQGLHLVGLRATDTRSLRLDRYGRALRQSNAALGSEQCGRGMQHWDQVIAAKLLGPAQL